MKSGFFPSRSAATFVSLALAGGSITMQAADFESEILPIFSKRCAKCHMEGESKGSLALDLDKISKEIGSSKAIVPGDPEKSDLVKVLGLPEDDDDRMPPEGPRLSELEVNMIKAWITDGAKLPGEEGKTEEKKAETKKPEEPAAAPETWTSTTGSSVTATLLKVDSVRKSILLKLEDGKTMEVPIAKLDEASKARAKAFWEKSHK